MWQLCICPGKPWLFKRQCGCTASRGNDTARLSDAGKVRADVDGELVKRFYRIFRPLQKKYKLQMHSYFSVYDEALIEIYIYEGEKRCYICKFKEEDAEDCYSKAIRELERFRDTRKETEYEEKAG